MTGRARAVVKPLLLLGALNPTSPPPNPCQLAASAPAFTPSSAPSVKSSSMSTSARDNMHIATTSDTIRGNWAIRDDSGEAMRYSSDGGVSSGECAQLLLTGQAGDRYRPCSAVTPVPGAHAHGPRPIRPPPSGLPPHGNAGPKKYRKCTRMHCRKLWIDVLGASGEANGPRKHRHERVGGCHEIGKTLGV